VVAVNRGRPPSCTLHAARCTTTPHRGLQAGEGVVSPTEEIHTKHRPSYANQPDLNQLAHAIVAYTTDTAGQDKPS
jgi:hypothetical protein